MGASWPAAVWPGVRAVAEAESLLGFTVRIRPPRGLSRAAEYRFDSALELYLHERNLLISGGPLFAAVHSNDRSLSATDQVDLLTWLVFEAGVPALAVGPLVPDCGAPMGDGPMICVHRSDPMLSHLEALYRNHRIDADLFLAVLGGQVRAPGREGRPS